MSLKKIVIPKNVNFFGSDVFYGNESLKDIFILCTSIPTLSKASLINNGKENYILWVNDDIIEELKIATNWTTFASHMRPLSEYKGEI